MRQFGVWNIYNNEIYFKQLRSYNITKFENILELHVLQEAGMWPRVQSLGFSKTLKPSGGRVRHIFKLQTP